MLFNLAKNSPLLQNIYVSLLTSIHPSIAHATGKIEMLKKAFFHATLDHMEGSYFEFGVYEGTSLLAAVKTHRTLSAKKSVDFFGKKFNRKFYGFDSFDDGFRYDQVNDEHSFFREGYLASSYTKCKKRFYRYPEASLIKGYFEDILRGRKASEMFPGDLCAILYIDCNLGTPALDALEFMRSSFQRGTIIILDDVFCYQGNPQRGVYGAWLEFLAKYPEIKTREFFSYGYTGKSYIIYAM